MTTEKKEFNTSDQIKKLIEMREELIGDLEDRIYALLGLKNSDDGAIHGFISELLGDLLDAIKIHHKKIAHYRLVIDRNRR